MRQCLVIFIEWHKASFELYTNFEVFVPYIE